MTRPERYFIGPSMKEKIGALISRDGSSPIGGGGDNIPVRLQSLAQGGGGKPLRLAKTTAAWEKNTLARIQLYETGTPPNEDSASEFLDDCVNKIERIDSGKWVLVAKATNGYWYLVWGEPTIHETEVVTSVTLGGTGLVIGKKKIFTHIASTAVASFTIPTTDCPSSST